MRIIAGSFGGRRITAPPGRETRPTPERVREALFSILGDLTGMRVLDLFAGSGALGIEALSRGATNATFVESAPPAMRVLRDNLATLGLEGRATTHLCDWVGAVRSEARAARRYDVCVADPPYSMTSAFTSQLDALIPVMEPGARVVVEHAHTDDPRLAGIGEVAVRRYGNTAISIGVVGRSDG